MLVHLHLPDLISMDNTCPQCDTPLPVRVVCFRQQWWVGQICPRCHQRGWTWGAYDTATEAEQALATYVRDRLEVICASRNLT
jgi:hypothetical protein